MAKETAPGGAGRPAVQAKTPANASGRSAKPVRNRDSAGGVSSRLGRAGNAPSIAEFFQGSRAELSKVTWPTRQEALNLTGAVIAMTVAMSVFLGIIDELVTLIINPILGAH